MCDGATARTSLPGRPRRRRRLAALGLALACAAPGLAGPASAQLPRARDLARPIAPNRPLPPRLAPPATSVFETAASPAGGAAILDLETRLLAFGSVAAGDVAEAPGGLRMRVVSDHPWFLYLTSDGLLVEDRGRQLPASRLSWRGEGGDFRPLRSGSPALVARGSATGPVGHPVSIDFRLEIDDHDPIGRLRADLRLQLAGQ